MSLLIFILITFVLLLLSWYFSYTLIVTIKRDEHLLCTSLACAGSREESGRGHSPGIWTEDQPGTFCSIHVVSSKPKINKLQPHPTTSPPLIPAFSVLFHSMCLTLSFSSSPQNKTLARVSTILAF